MASSSSNEFHDVNVALLPIDSCHVIPSVIIADDDVAIPQQIVIEELDDTLGALVNRIITDANLGGLDLDAATDCEIYFQLNKPPPSNRKGLGHATVPATDIRRRLKRLMKDPANPLLYFVYYIGKAREAHRKEGLTKASYAARGITHQPKSQPTAQTPARDLEPRDLSQITSPRTSTSQGARSKNPSTANASRPTQPNSLTTPSPRRSSPTTRPQQRSQVAARAPQRDVYIFTASDDELEQDQQGSRNQQSSSQSQSQSRSQRVSSSPVRARSISPGADGGHDYDESESAAPSPMRASTMTSSKQLVPRAQQIPSSTSSSRRHSTSSQPTANIDTRGRSQTSSQQQPDVTGRKRRRSQSPSAQTLFREYDINSFPVLYAGDMKSFMCQLCRADISMPQRMHIGTVKRHFHRTKLLNHQHWLELNAWALPKESDPLRRPSEGSLQTGEEGEESVGRENHHEETDEEADNAIMTRDGPDASEARE